MIALDLCSGTKSVTTHLRQLGWVVTSLDVLPELEPDICIDVRQYVHAGAVPDFIWASPPCTEFSKQSMPWTRTDIVPDMSIYRACVRIISEVKPKFWCIENVRGAQEYFGKCSWCYGPYYLWTNIPRQFVTVPLRNKMSVSGKYSLERARIPGCLVSKIHHAINQLGV